MSTPENPRETPLENPALAPANRAEAATGKPLSGESELNPASTDPQTGDELKTSMSKPAPPVTRSAPLPPISRSSPSPPSS